MANPSTLYPNPLLSGTTFHVSKVQMKILLPADENERRRIKERLENQLRRTPGGPWRVYIVPGRYGWYARAERVRRRKGKFRGADSAD